MTAQRSESSCSQNESTITTRAMTACSQALRDREGRRSPMGANR